MYEKTIARVMAVGLGLASCGLATDVYLVYEVHVTAKLDSSHAVASLRHDVKVVKHWANAELFQTPATIVAMVYVNDALSVTAGSGATSTASWRYAFKAFDEMPVSQPLGQVVFLQGKPMLVMPYAFKPYRAIGATGDNDPSGLAGYVNAAWSQAEKEGSGHAGGTLFWNPTVPAGRSSYTTGPAKQFSYDYVPKADDGQASVHLTINYTLAVNEKPAGFDPTPAQVSPEHKDDSCKQQQSIVGCQDQSLGEEVALAGVDFRLRYQSERMAGRLGSGGWTAQRLALGGWSLSVHHAWDAATQTLYLGNGRRRSGANVRALAGTGGDLLIPSQPLGSVYVFDANGRHLRTLDEGTGSVVYEFGYDSTGRLVSVKDGAGNTTAIERSGSAPTAIVGPYGHRTALGVDANGYLSLVRAPDGATVRAQYDAGGLMTSFTGARGNTNRFTYGTGGLLMRDEDAAGAVLALADLSGGTGLATKVTNAVGAVTTFTTTADAAGRLSSVTQFADGTRTTMAGTSAFPDAVMEADGTKMEASYAADPLWGQQGAFAASLTTTTPAGLARSVRKQRTVEVGSSANPLSLKALRETMTVNGRASRKEYSAEARTWTRTSAEGRVWTRRLDALGRVVEERRGGVEPKKWSYDARGRVSAVTVGTGDEARTARFEYGADGAVSKATDATGRVTGVQYDAARRPVKLTRPDGQSVQMGYDESGNMTSITPPGRGPHKFGYTAVNLRASYQAPGQGLGLAWKWNADRTLAGIQTGDGGQVRRSYDAAGRWSGETTPSGRLDRSYAAATGQWNGAADAEGNGIAWTFDGKLVTGTQWTGAVSGSLEKLYDAGFRLSGLGVNGGAAVAFVYDGDGLPTGAGELAVSRDAASGQATGLALDQVTEARTYNGFGELVEQIVTGPAGALYSAKLQRDKLGRITEKAETVDGATAVYRYGYDDAGRLVSVDKDGAAARYAYGVNGNRLRGEETTGSEDAVYDEQDRLVRRGAAIFTWDGNGRLASKIAGGQVTQYAYEAGGTLRRVTLPDGRELRYVTDALGRRTGKMVNGALTQGWLWQDALRPAAELDANGAVMSVFVYDLGSGAPAYMVKGGARYRIVTDAVGSVRVVVNAATGEAAQRMDYDAFGRVTADTNPGFQPFGFAGGLYDVDSGLVRFGARDYDAESGRWTGWDPLLFGSRDTNLYTYAANDPVNRRDRTGLEPDPVSAVLDGLKIAASSIPGAGTAIALYDLMRMNEAAAAQVQAAAQAQAKEDKAAAGEAGAKPERDSLDEETARIMREEMEQTLEEMEEAGDEQGMKDSKCETYHGGGSGSSGHPGRR